MDAYAELRAMASRVAELDQQLGRHASGDQPMPANEFRAAREELEDLIHQPLTTAQLEVIAALIDAYGPPGARTH